MSEVVLEGAGAKRVAVCNTCTLRLVRLAYQRAPWFRLVREPLRLGMQAMARWHHVAPDRYLVRTPACYGCVRFYKNALKEESATFRWLNDRVNPLFDAFLERIVAPGEVADAKAYARAASVGASQRDRGRRRQVSPPTVSPAAGVQSSKEEQPVL